MQNKFEDALKQLHKRAISDESFRELAKSDAHAALKEVGFDAPSTAKIVFTEPEDGVTVFSLYPKADSESTLSYEELENVSGGTTPYYTINFPGCP